MQGGDITGDPKWGSGLSLLRSWSFPGPPCTLGAQSEAGRKEEGDWKTAKDVLSRLSWPCPEIHVSRSNLSSDTGVLGRQEEQQPWGVYLAEEEEEEGFQPCETPGECLGAEGQRWAQRLERCRGAASPGRGPPCAGGCRGAEQGPSLHHPSGAGPSAGTAPRDTRSVQVEQARIAPSFIKKTPIICLNLLFVSF